MDRTFDQINQLAQERMSIAPLISYVGFTPLAGRHKPAREQMERLWEFLSRRGWNRADKTHQFARVRGSNGWILPPTREVYVKTAGRPVGVQLQILLHEAVHAYEVDELGYSDFSYAKKYGGLVGAEVRAEAASCMVLDEISRMSGAVGHAADYISYHNWKYGKGQQYFPEDFEDQIKHVAGLLHSVVVG